MTQDLLNVLWGVLGTIGTALATWLSSLLISFLNSKIKDTKLKTWLTGITTIVTDTVKSIYQQTVEALKNNGGFTKEAQEEAKNKALDTILNQLTPDMRKFIEENYGDIADWIGNQIETAIYNLKNK